MPQGRRKIPFSGKAKKAQMQLKKDGQNQQRSRSPSSTPKTEVSKVVSDAAKDITSDITKGVKLGGSGGGRSRYELRFQTETPEERDATKKKASESLPSKAKSRETPTEAMYPREGIDFPTRPEWNESMSKHVLDLNEEKYFQSYEDAIFNKWKSSLSYFELNLETWRQLWRVIEMSDVLLLVVDVRYTPAMIPPSLFRVVRENRKDLIVVLNKVDLIPPPLVIAWREYILQHYPGIFVTLFTSCPSYNLAKSDALSLYSKYGLQSRRLRGNISMAAEGAKGVFEVCKRIVKGSKVNLDSWEEKISEALNERNGTTYSSDEDINVPSQSTEGRFIDGILTIGMIGQPNAGKSSLINSLLGKKAVSVSRTPGHTKHFQTMFISDSVKLCDCPGLVFPSLVPKSLQIIMGSFPIAQVKDPYGAIRYIAERVDLPSVLKISHTDKRNVYWTPIEICEAWANKRCYRTAKSNRPDIYRSANHILRMTLEGKIPLWLIPPGYNVETWNKNDASLHEVFYLLGLSSIEEGEEKLAKDYSSDESTNDESESNEDSESEGKNTLPKTSNKFMALMLSDNDEAD
ncbi:guanine nucleotide-binding protein-like 1 [Lepeophtheirus salmonis]|uniref:Guanine nucleotide-binding protein-like 1 n=1 Tax=Lepeophtheirus salmonis TaxID=72036 RepID=A0A0K2TM31_LEPSM|nr:guanine nucleotide-binding protein-like 1 [Lepeophtheirus salmonis]